MDEFYMFLILGLLIISAMLVFLVGDLGINFGVSDGVYKPRPSNGGIISPATTTTIPLIISDETVVGPENVETWRNVKLGTVNTSYMSGETKYNIPEKYLFNGLIFGGNDFRVEADVDINNFIGAYIEFDISKTNEYGALAVKVNGEVISDSVLSAGSHKFVIRNSLIKEKNIVELVPASSQWKIWAPAVYEIRDFNFVYEKHFSQASSFHFNIYQEEAAGLSDTKGRIVLDLPEHSGALKILLNSNEIFSNTTSGYQTIYYNQQNLVSGENSVQLFADEEAEFGGEASLIFYYWTTRDNEIAREVTIDQARYSKLDSNRGEISFNVTRIMNPGGIIVSIENSQGNSRTLAYDVLQQKQYSYYFNSSQAFSGKNIVRIKSLDSSLFYISDLEIEI